MSMGSGKFAKYGFLMVGQTGAPRESPHKLRENMQTPDRKTQPALQSRGFLLWADSANHWA